MRYCIIALCLFLAGCGTHYRVTVDSLQGELPDPQANTYCLLPGNTGVEQDDLLFRDVARTLVPAFTARGYRVVEQCAEAGHIARIAYWEEQPRTIVRTGTVRRTKPVRVRDGRYRTRIEYISVEEPTISTSTTYGASLLITAFSQLPSGEGKQVWRTSVTCFGAEGSFRTLLKGVIPVLESTLGTRTEGDRQFDVLVNDKGETSLDEIY